MNWNDLRLRVRALTLRKRAEKDLEDELGFHIEMETRKNLAAGMSPEGARRHARIQFGGSAQVEEECRDARRVRLIDTLWQDVRYAIRGFCRAPAFVLTVIATIALGLGLNTTLFTIFNAYVLRPVSAYDPYSLYAFTWTNVHNRGHGFSWPEYQEFRKDNPAFREVFAFRNLQARVDGKNSFGQLVTGNYFHMLGVDAALGRVLTPEDSSAPGREQVVVLSYQAWQNRFSADPNIVGKKVMIRGCPLEIVGVAREGFVGLGELPEDFWAPLTIDALLEEGPDLFGPEHPGRLSIIGRLQRGLSVEQAKAGLTIWSQRTSAGLAEPERAIGVSLQPRATNVPLSRQAVLLFTPIVSAFGLVLLIACANVANMMLARAMARQREIGIRLSLGAARSRLIRQLLTECVLLSLPAAALGFVVSQATIEWGVRLMFATIPSEFVDFLRIVPMTPDLRVFGFMLGAAIASAVLFGLAPALQATRPNVVQAARGDFTNEFRPGRLRNFLVIGQITVCLLLLICAGVLLRGARRMQNLEIGLKTRDVVEIEIKDQLRSQILAKVFSEPLARAVAATEYPPLDGAFPHIPAAADDSDDAVQAMYTRVSPEYFDMFEIPITRGRNFTLQEANGGAPVAIISQATAHKLWPNRDALGQSMRLMPDARTGHTARHYSTVRVVGIARDVVSGFIGNGLDSTCVYFPVNLQSPGSALLVRVHGDAETARRKLEAGLTALDPGAIEQIHKMQEFVAGQIYPFQVAYWLGSAVGGLALLLTLSGIYGVLSYAVSQRTKEIGIRIAMGATERGVTGLVLKQSMGLAAVGIPLGALLGLGVSRIFASALVMINTFDALAYSGAVLLVLVTCAAAAYFPSRRAARIDPISTLRYD